jgi:CRP/FNR family transcriptional regulator
MISNKEIIDLLKLRFNGIFEEGLIQEIIQFGKYEKVPSGEYLIDIDEEIREIPLLINGSIKVFREDEHGNELLLYYLESGDTCAMSLNCCLQNKKSEIRAQTETDSEVIRFPINFMDIWMVKYKSWRVYVIESFNNRFEELLEAIDSIAFMKMDERLHKYLIDKVKVTGDTCITNTHQEIATDLNTSRVVVSRLLKQLEKKGEIKIYRNKIEVLNF